MSDVDIYLMADGNGTVGLFPADFYESFNVPTTWQRFKIHMISIAKML